MDSKLFQFHWFDKTIAKTLERYEIQEPVSQLCLERATSLAQAAFKTTTAMIILADFQNYKIKSNQILEDEVVEKLFDLAHLLKEVDSELWCNFSNQAFIQESELWKPVLDFQFFSCQPIENEMGIILGWLCLFDKQRRLEDVNLMATLKTMADMVMDELELRIQIKRSNRLQNEIIHLAAHDLKNPLSGILGITDHIKKQINNAEQLDEICDLIKESSKRMMVILDDILKSGYLENGKIQLKVMPQRFGEVIRHVVFANQAAADKKRQSIFIDIVNEPCVLIDKARMIEVLDNLINNAIKYAPKDAEIQIRTWEEKGEVLFSIFNPGVGLTEDDKSRIFHKFSKLSAKPTGGETSTGLGLSIVKMITELHGGTISAESEGLEHGVRFLLQMPALAQLA